MIAEVAARLTVEVAALKQIGGAVEFEAASAGNPKATPAAFVVPLAEDPAPSDLANTVIQRVRVSLGVVWAVKNVADPKGAAAQADLATLRAAGQAALLGWAPTDAEPLERGAGRLLAFRDGVLWWQDVYQTNIYVRN